ncbi:hypothetical protein J8281_11315 [Aquimarina sp. U1-2]|uniref:hypothetical protein n=1 Tax=Aquimarina sp. U1-2 TaxID=2823141 RepID=UPI001AED00FB|nr:hypothetical protein [Aquimarina sp. U1-2]MBP2832776.1 hypothetical protein [Aquimarina sp. U1-2]
MKITILLSITLFLSANLLVAQHLEEQEWAKLSEYIASGNIKKFEDDLAAKNFTKAEDTNGNYTFYNWKNTEPFYYGVRVNKASKQVTYMTNDQQYVLKLLSRFLSEYTLINSDQKDTTSRTHIFQSSENTIAIKLDLSTNKGTHLLFAKTKS